MLEVEEHSGASAHVSFVHQHRATLQQVRVALECQVKDGIQERMARTDECGEWLPLGRHQRFLERDSLVPWKYRLSNADQTIPVSHRRRNMGDLVASRLALLRGTAQTLEGFQKEGFDV